MLRSPRNGWLQRRDSESVTALACYLTRVGVLFVLWLLPLTGCGGPPAPDLVVYSALDGEFSEPILKDYAREAELTLAPKFDTEAFKTIGLYRAIVEERNRPRCDVFWNNEILSTLRLQEQGLLQPYSSPQAKRFPERFRSADGSWYGFAARARVLVVNEDRVPAADRPKSILDLTDSRWKGRIGMAKPLYGTTFTHACCLFGHWGDDRAKQFFEQLKANEVQIVGGNKDVAEQVATGKLDLGLTDTDDAVAFRDQKSYPLAIIYLDRDAKSDDLGTLFIPNSLSIVKDCPHPEAARRLIDHLLAADVEARLAAGASAQIPLGQGVEANSRVETPATVKALPVDFTAAAKKWDTAHQFLRATFGAGP